MAIAKMLSIQMMLAPTGPCEVTKIKIRKGEINRKAIGYIYGFVDGALHALAVLCILQVNANFL